jgi:DEAD/DEAH box helicase domain-containing protein
VGLVVMDLEIKEAVDESNPARGWGAARAGKLGVSVVCIYDYDTDRYHFYDDHNIGVGVDHLESADTVVTFNGQEFDLPCLSGVYGQTIRPRGQYDILQEVWKSLGKRTKGYGLGPICERTLGLSKTGAGVTATDLWNENRTAELYSYCLADVHLTTTLFDHIMTHGHIIDLNGDKLKIDIGERVEVTSA